MSTLDYGAAPPSPFHDNSPVSDDDIALMQRVFRAAAQNPLQIPPELIGFFIDSVQTSKLTIPINQIQGFSQYLARAAFVFTSESLTAGTGYHDLATVGPQIDGLPDGKYAIFVSALVTTGVAGAGYITPNVNGGLDNTPSDQDSGSLNTGSITATAMGFSLHTLNQGSNTVKAQYLANGATASFNNRRLLVLKIANL